MNPSIKLSPGTTESRFSLAFSVEQKLLLSRSRRASAFGSMDLNYSYVVITIVLSRSFHQRIVSLSFREAEALSNDTRGGLESRKLPAVTGRGRNCWSMEEKMRRPSVRYVFQWRNIIRTALLCHALEPLRATDIYREISDKLHDSDTTATVILLVWT